jgi:hypothetical protein
MEIYISTIPARNGIKIINIIPKADGPNNLSLKKNRSQMKAR